MKIVHVCDFHRFEEIRCDRCAMLRAMETGRVHVDAIIKKSDGEGVHLVAFAPYHIADMDYCSSNMDFAKRVWALQPNKRLVWQSCLQRLSQVPRWDCDYQPLSRVLMMDYLWSAGRYCCGAAHCHCGEACVDDGLQARVACRVREEIY